MWKGVTLLCVTHDVLQTQGFDRVLVIEGGRVVENGTPAGLPRPRDVALRAAPPRRRGRP